MHRIDTPNNVAGLFADPDPIHGQMPVVVDADWLNDVQENLIAVLVAAGIAPAEGDYSQLTAAIEALAHTGGSFIINGPAGTDRPLVFYTAGVPRWEIQEAGDAETGGDAGSPINFASFHDDGTPKTVVMQLRRDTGAVWLSGNLGIGTNTPNRALHIVGAASAEMNLEQSNGQVDHRTWNLLADSGSGGVPTDFTLRLLSDNGLTVQHYGFTVKGTNGFMGVGTTAPVKQLHVVGAASAEFQLEYTGGQADHRSWNTLVGGAAGAPANYSVRLMSDDGFATQLTGFTILGASGCVGFGTTNPVKAVHISGATSGELQIEQTNGQADHRSWNLLVDGGSGATPSGFSLRQMTDDGSSTNFYALQVNGTTGIVTFNQGAATSTLAAGDNSTRVATTAYVDRAAGTAQAAAQAFATSAANTAQSNAQTFATGAANTAQGNAQAYAAGLVAAVPKPFTGWVESGEYAVTGFDIDYAHGKGATPKLWSCVMRCKLAEHGYPVDKELQMPFIGYDGLGGGGNGGATVSADATNISIAFMNGTVLGAIDASTGAYANLTPGNWRFVFRGYFA